MKFILGIIGALLFVFGLVDLGVYYIFDYDITGWSWFPYIATAIGGLLAKIGFDE